MKIKINAKGIKETIGKGKRFQNLPKKLKELKVATIRHLRWIIENAELLSDDVKNIHNNNGYRFAYFLNKIYVDGRLVVIRISVMKRIGSNWFWIHNVDEI